MKKSQESAYHNYNRPYASPGGSKVEDKKVHFEPSPGFRDKKYEGYSIGGSKVQLIKGKKEQKGNIKDKKLDEEFIHNLHQHIYYLEMQLKLLYYSFDIKER